MNVEAIESDIARLPQRVRHPRTSNRNQDRRFARRRSPLADQMKRELADRRARLADYFYSISEPISGSATSGEVEGQSKGAPHINGIAPAGNDSASLGSSVLPTEREDGGIINKLRAHSAT